MKLVSDRLGHTTIAITADIYGHILEGRDKVATDIFDERLRDAMGIPVHKAE